MQNSKKVGKKDGYTNKILSFQKHPLETFCVVASFYFNSS